MRRSLHFPTNEAKSMFDAPRMDSSEGDGAGLIESPDVSVGSASMVVRHARKVPQANQPHVPEPKAALLSCRPLVGWSPSSVTITENGFSRKSRYRIFCLR